MEFVDFMFWLHRVFDAHVPIVRKFGRVPDYNLMLGRETTAEEEQWLKEKGWSSSLPEEEARKIRQGIESGVWSEFVDLPEYDD